MRFASLASSAVIAICTTACCWLTGQDDSITPFSETEKEWFIDTLQHEYEMQDDRGFRQTFYIDPLYFGYPFSTHYKKNYHQGRCAVSYHEQFQIAYTSSLNHYRYQLLLYSSKHFWLLFNDVSVSYYLDRRYLGASCRGRQLPLMVTEIEEKTIGSKTYHNLLRFTINDVGNIVPESDPVDIYYAAGYGIIEFTRKDGIVLQRVE